MYSKEVAVWNTVMDNHPRQTDSDEAILRKVERQSAFVVEEAKEIQDGARKRDVQEILDGYLDTKFTNDQIGVYLEALGVDLEGAWVEVVRSNNSKFSTDKELMARSAVTVSQKQGFTTMTESPVQGVFILKRDVDRKIMKPECFKEPNLRPFIPKHLRGKR